MSRRRRSAPIRCSPDSDADGVSDSDEIDLYGTDALDPDTDGDGLDDAEELASGTNPPLRHRRRRRLGQRRDRCRIRPDRCGEHAGDAGADSRLDARAGIGADT